MRGNEGIAARIDDLKITIAEGVVEFEIRNCSARSQVLQNQLDNMLNLQRARGLLYADHPEGATGMVTKDYRGQKARKEIWKFDSALVSQILKTLKQAAIEVGQWNEKRPSSSEVGISEITRRLKAGRQRVAEDKLRRDADEQANKRNATGRASSHQPSPTSPETLAFQ